MNIIFMSNDSYGTEFFVGWNPRSPVIRGDSTIRFRDRTANRSRPTSITEPEKRFPTHPFSRPPCAARSARPADNWFGFRSSDHCEAPSNVVSLLRYTVSAYPRTWNYARYDIFSRS
jgi:hypothetical protein